MFEFTKATCTPEQDPRNQLLETFQTPPDSAGILQGKRKIRKGRHHARTVLFPSRKNGSALIACEGRLEGELALALELHPRVTAFRGQALAIPGPNNRLVVPDFGVIMDRRFVVIDVKPSGLLANPEVAQRMRHVRNVLEMFGIPHYLITEIELQREPHLQIRRQLFKSLHLDLTAYQRDAVLAVLKGRLMIVSELRRQACEMGFSPFIVEALAARGHLSFATHKPWRNTTLLGDHHGSNRTTYADRSSVLDLCIGL